MARKEFDAPAFVREHKATKAQVTKGEAKVCTAKGCVCGNVPLDLDAFYRDKSQAGGRSPWCKAKERTYNAAYYGALKAKGVEAPRKRDIANDKGVASFNRRMKDERVTRVRKVDNTRTTKAKATTKARKASRTRKATA